MTVLVHGESDYEMAVEATNILFGKATKESLLKLDEETLLAVFDGVQKFALIDMEYILKNVPAYERANEQLKVKE